MRIGNTEYEIIEQVGEWDYDWHIGALLRGPDGQLYFATDSGCSCTDYGDNLYESDLTPVKSPHEAVELAKEAFSDADVVDFAKRLLF